jgi:hypothetical protein
MAVFPLHDSGDRVKFSTGAVRDTAEDKPDFTPVTTVYLQELLLRCPQVWDDTNKRPRDVVELLESKLVDKDASFGYRLTPSYEEYSPGMPLIPDLALQRLAVHYWAGARKYEPRNWEKGIPISRYYASALRHLIQWANGDRREDHLAAALFNVMGIIFTEEAVNNGELPKDLGDLGWISLDKR